MQEDIGELLADVARERDEYLELARRTKADFENYRKRVAGEAARPRRAGGRRSSASSCRCSTTSSGR